MIIENLPRFLLIKILQHQSLMIYLYDSEIEALREVCDTLARMPDDIGEIGIILYDSEEDKIIQERKRRRYTLNYTDPMKYVAIAHNYLRTVPVHRLNIPTFIISSSEIDNYILEEEEKCGSSSNTSSEQARNLQTTDFRVLNRKLMQGCVSKEDVIVRVRSQEHADTLLRYLKEGGFTWENSDDLLSHDDYFTECDNDICYFINSNKRLVSYNATSYLNDTSYFCDEGRIINYEDVCYKATKRDILPDLTDFRTILCMTEKQAKTVIDLYKAYNYDVEYQEDIQWSDWLYLYVDIKSKSLRVRNKCLVDHVQQSYFEWLENAYNYIKTRRIIND